MIPHKNVNRTQLTFISSTKVSLLDGSTLETQGLPAMTGGSIPQCISPIGYGIDLSFAYDLNEDFSLSGHVQLY